MRDFRCDWGKHDYQQATQETMRKQYAAFVQWAENSASSDNAFTALLQSASAELPSLTLHAVLLNDLRCTYLVAHAGGITAIATKAMSTPGPFAAPGIDEAVMLESSTIKLFGSALLDACIDDWVPDASFSKHESGVPLCSFVPHFDDEETVHTLSDLANQHGLQLQKACVASVDKMPRWLLQPQAAGGFDVADFCFWPESNDATQAARIARLCAHSPAAFLRVDPLPRHDPAQKLACSCYFAADMLAAMQAEADAADKSLSAVMLQAFRQSHAQLFAVCDTEESDTWYKAAPPFVKQRLWFLGDTLDAIEALATRLDRSTSWVLHQAWVLAHATAQPHAREAP